MSDDVVTRVEGLGKKYLVGHQAERERYTALRDVMARGAKGLWRKAADMARGRAIGGGEMARLVQPQPGRRSHRRLPLMRPRR